MPHIVHTKTIFQLFSSHRWHSQSVVLNAIQSLTFFLEYNQTESPNQDFFTDCEWEIIANSDPKDIRDWVSQLARKNLDVSYQ